MIHARLCLTLCVFPCLLQLSGHGKQRIPLITGIGSAICVNDITREELEGAVAELDLVHATLGASA